MLTDDDISFLIKDIKTNYDNYDSKSSSSLIYTINNYIFENDLRLSFKILRVQKVLRILVTITSYHNPDYEDDYYHDWLDSILLVKEFYISNDNVEIAIKDIISFMCSFRTEYRYSKILDKIDKNSAIITSERKHIILKKLCSEKEHETCCVCYESNTVYTSCLHNLCRKCHSNIKCVLDDEMEIEIKHCPMCRQEI
jgi:hypothetical protein